MVPVEFQGKAKDLHWLDSYGVDYSNWRTGLLGVLVDRYLEKECYMCKSKVPGEGVVLRVEGKEWNAFKLKSFKFLMRESEALDQNDVGIDSGETPQ